MKPTRGYVIIKPLEEEEKTKSGLFVPDTAKDKPDKGVVMQIGLPPFMPNGDLVLPDFNIGDTVVYRKWAGVDYKEYSIVTYADVLAIWPDSKN